MNVTERGYFTSQYLDNVNKRSPRQDLDERPHFKKSASSGKIRQITPRPSAMDLHPRAASANKVALSKISASSPPSPDSTNFGMSPESQLTNQVSESVDPLDYDPDDLQQELTPAQLNVLQKQYARPRHRPRSYYDDDSIADRQSDLYDNYYSRDHQLQRVPRGERRRPQKKQKPRGGDYYIKQKKLYDEAEFVKPTNYTHKTFKDVFDDDHEDDKRYNPMLYVFDDPEKVREQEQKDKVKTAFKSLQVKLGKNDYRNYDYYANKDVKPSAVNDVFVAGGDSDDSDDENVAVNPEVFRSDAEAQMARKKGKFKSLWKKKMKRAKKELGKDYKKNLEKQWDMEDEVRRNRELAALAREEELASAHEPIVEEPDDDPKGQFYGGPRQEFHPLWNYLLSWVAYDQGAQAAALPPQTQPQITEVVEDDVRTIVKSQPPKSAGPAPQKTKKIRVSAGQLKNFNKNLVRNYKGLKSKWNMPAGDFFNKGMDTATLDQPLPQSIIDIERADDNSQEFIIEVDDDSSTVDNELFFNPLTGQLEREPPTSFSSMDESDRVLTNYAMKSKAGGRFIDANQSAKGIVSNINGLIKSIKIMKIIFAPIDIIAESFPHLQTIVIMVELVIFMWILYELSLLIDALCMMVKAICAPMIAMGKFMNRIM